MSAPPPDDEETRLPTHGGLAVAFPVGLGGVPGELRRGRLPHYGPTLALLTHPEFLTTSLMRRLGRPLLP
jgi:hypothetical protein